MNLELEKLKQFRCQQCNECCRQAGFVYLGPGEAERIAGFLGLDVYEFNEKFTSLQDRQKLILKKNPDESCVFLTDQGCSIHAVKPKQCLDFPVSWRTAKSLDYCAGLKLLSKS